MARDQILVVTNTDDPHADDVIVALERGGHESVRLNTDDFPGATLLSLTWGGDEDTGGDVRGSIEVLTNGRVVDPQSVRSVWWRRPGYYGLPDDLTLQEREFATSELDHALRGLWACLDCYWISHPERIRQASWKGEQLSRARRIGFAVPRTLVTTDPERARAFLDECGGRMVFKVMSDPFLGVEKTARDHPEAATVDLQAATTLVTQADVAMLDAVRSAPCLFQEHVPTDVELRVTMIGDELFAAEIHSQDDPRTALDRRRPEVDVPYLATELPVDVAERCQAFVRSYGLNFSVLNLIRTPDGEHVFVENDPNGQFLFVEEQLPQLAMTEALASCLVRGSNG